MKYIISSFFLCLLIGCETPPDWIRNTNWNNPALQNYGNSLSNPDQREPVKQKSIDLNCMRDCRNANYSYNYCESKCSY